MNNNPAQQSQDQDPWLEILSLSNNTPPIKIQRAKPLHDEQLTKSQKYRATIITKIPARLEELKQKLRVLTIARRHYSELDIPEELIKRIKFVKMNIAQTQKRLAKYKLNKSFKSKHGTMFINDYTLPHIQFFKTLITFEFRQWDRFVEADLSDPDYIEQAKFFKTWKDQKTANDNLALFVKYSCRKKLIMGNNHGSPYPISRAIHYNRLQLIYDCLDMRDTEISLSAKDGRWLITRMKNTVSKLKAESAINYTLPQEPASHLENPEYRRESMRGPYRRQYTGYDLEEIRQARPLERLLTTAWKCQLRQDERELLISLASQCQSYFESIFLQEVKEDSGTRNACESNTK